VYFGARELRVHHAALLRVIAAMGEVDAAVSTASFRAGRRDWTRPSFVQPGAPANLSNLRHPLLVDAVPNSVSLAPGRGLLITGSNMSGKSTLLRTVGVTAILAQTLNTCLASEYYAPVFNVRSCIGRSAVSGAPSHPGFRFRLRNGWRREGGRDKDRWLAQFGSAKLSGETDAR
jgi:dsDNA-specific endonuclease/ATPase MutS2